MHALILDVIFNTFAIDLGDLSVWSEKPRKVTKDRRQFLGEPLRYISIRKSRRLSLRPSRARERERRVKGNRPLGSESIAEHEHARRWPDIPRREFPSVVDRTFHLGTPRSLAVVSPTVPPSKSLSLANFAHVHTRIHAAHCSFPFASSALLSSSPLLSHGLVDCQKTVTHRIPGVLALCHATNAPPSHPGFRGAVPASRGRRVTPDGCNGTTHIRSRPPRRPRDTHEPEAVRRESATVRRGGVERERSFDRAHIPYGSIFPCRNGMH